MGNRRVGGRGRKMEAGEGTVLGLRLTMLDRDL
jgi:hypothetical protein